MKDLKVTISKFDGLMAAVTFAEAGEHETARSMMRDESQSKTSGKKAGTDFGAGLVVKHAK